MITWDYTTCDITWGWGVITRDYTESHSKSGRERKREREREREREIVEMHDFLIIKHHATRRVWLRTASRARSHNASGAPEEGGERPPARAAVGTRAVCDLWLEREREREDGGKKRVVREREKERRGEGKREKCSDACSFARTRAGREKARENDSEREREAR
jgi:hypothetical protein